MKINLLKAIKNTHRHPINIILHCIGLPLYILGIYFIIVYFMNQNVLILHGITLLVCSISLFILGHKIEGNLRAITIVVLYKYLKSILQNWINFEETKDLLLNNSNLLLYKYKFTLFYYVTLR